DGDSDGDGGDGPWLVDLPGRRSGQRGDATADPEPAGRVERRQPQVGHVVQGRAVGEPGQVLGPELLVDGDAEQVQLGGAQRHAQRHDGEGGYEHQTAQPDKDPVAAPAPQPADGDQPGQAGDLPDGGQRVQLVG